MMLWKKIVSVAVSIAVTSYAFTPCPILVSQHRQQEQRQQNSSSNNKRSSSSSLLPLKTAVGDNSRHNIIIIDNKEEQQQQTEEILWDMCQFFGNDMVDPISKRFYYFCFPSQQSKKICEHVHFPIRDLAAAWDATKVLEFLLLQLEQQQHLSSSSSCSHTNNNTKKRISNQLQQQLNDAILSTLSSYKTSPLNTSSNLQGLHLSEDVLLEKPNIGHSALFLLAACGAINLGIMEEQQQPQQKLIIEAINGLTLGILSMQLENGAFCIEFDCDGGSGDSNNYLRGIEFFPGEAMLALMTVLIQQQQPSSMSSSSERLLLDESTQQDILPAMERAFEFYSNYYYTADVDINYNIWQVMAFAKLYDYYDLTKTTKTRFVQQQQQQQQIANYIIDLCYEICQSKSWKYQLSRGQSFYMNLQTIEIACGLDALVEGIRIASSQQDGKNNDDDDDDEEGQSRLLLFQLQAKNAIHFLKWSQEQIPDNCIVGKGGLGYGGIQVLEQRLDVTGHAISALTKWYNLCLK